MCLKSLFVFKVVTKETADIVNHCLSVPWQRISLFYDRVTKETADIVSHRFSVTRSSGQFADCSIHTFNFVYVKLYEWRLNNLNDFVCPFST